MVTLTVMKRKFSVCSEVSSLYRTWWYRGLKKPQTWEEFKEQLTSFYLADKEKDQLMQAITDRAQKSGEDSRSYMLELTPLINHN